MVEWEDVFLDIALRKQNLRKPAIISFPLYYKPHNLGIIKKLIVFTEDFVIQ